MALASASSSPSRLGYIDWLRGLACLVMFQTHCYDAWLNPEARKTKFFMWSQIGGTLPAPLFLFLAGISFALIISKLLQKGVTLEQIGRTTILRGAEVFGLGMLMRLQEFLISWGWAPWSDLWRVDVLNTIGVSMMLMGVMCWLVLATNRPTNPTLVLGTSAALVASAIAFLTPLLWTTWRMRWLPWPIESYIDGVHNLGEPQSWLFPIFPWGGFAFVGLAAGFVLFSDWAKRTGASVFVLAGAAGIGMMYLSLTLDHNSIQVYPVYDYWHTSPNFFLFRVGLLLAVLFLGYGWCRWGAGQWGFSPLIQLGQTSLLVYWVHIELVYGRIAILRHGSTGIRGASVGLLVIFLAMLLLSMARTKWKPR